LAVSIANAEKADRYVVLLFIILSVLSLSWSTG